MLHERFGLFPGRSPLLGESLLFSLPGGTKMFQFPPFASIIIIWIAGLQPAGLSHSEIPGSKVICTYPGLIAAYHVLHRLREPRHPPCALTCFRHNECAGTYISRHSLLILSAVDYFLFSIYSLACVNMSKISSARGRIVENIGVEPMTSCMPCKRSSQLS